MTFSRALSLLLPLGMLTACDIMVKEVQPREVALATTPQTGPTPVVEPLPGNPGSFVVTSSSASQIRLQWTAPTGNVTSYLLASNVGGVSSMPSVPANCNAATVLTLAPGTTQHTISSLLPEVGYTFRLCAMNRNGEKSSGVTVSAMTLAAPPSNASGLMATTVSQSRIDVSWTAAPAGATGYRLAYQQGAIPPASCSAGTVVSLTGRLATSHPLSGLPPATSYAFRLCAVNSNPTPDVSSGITTTGRTEGDLWADTTRTGVPQRRDGHTAVWTGSRMIVWGGRPDDTEANYLNNGGQYDPAANLWFDVATSGAPTARVEHTAVWTGTKMIVWGGLGNGSTPLNTGGIFDPSAAMASAWTGVTTSDGSSAPPARNRHTAVWTGTRMIVWGGGNATGVFNTGGSYDPQGKTWETLGNAGGGPPPARESHTATWATSRMIVWGGVDANGNPMGDGAMYNPSGNGSWERLTADLSDYAASSDAPPSPRWGHTAVWNGTSLIIWGGKDNSGELSDGGMYNPSTDRWTRIAASPLGARSGHTAVVTSQSSTSRMIVWGGSRSSGYLADGALFDPQKNEWVRTTRTAGAPAARMAHTAIWSGSQMVVWGGEGLSAGVRSSLDDGGRYTLP